MNHYRDVKNIWQWRPPLVSLCQSHIYNFITLNWHCTTSWLTIWPPHSIINYPWKVSRGVLVGNIEYWHLCLCFGHRSYFSVLVIDSSYGKDKKTISGEIGLNVACSLRVVFGCGISVLTFIRRMGKSSCSEHYNSCWRISIYLLLT